MAEFTTTLEKTLDKLIEDKKYSSIKDILSTMAAEDVAMIIQEFDEKSGPLIFRLLPKKIAADAFIEMDSDIQEKLIKGFSDKELSAILDELYVNEAVDLVEEMPANVVERILSHVDTETRRAINQILQYPENSAGSIMTTEYVCLKLGTTVGQAIEHIRKYGIDKKSFYTCYVTQDKKLIGRLSVKDLLLAKDDNVKIDELLKTNVISIHTHTDKEEVVQMFTKYNFMALPVVDNEERMVGIIAFDDAIDVMEDETTEDIAIMAGMTPSDKTYLRSSPFSLFKQRIGWLLLLMVSSTFTGMIITNFESALAAQVILTAFIPMLMGTGGNSGSQSSVTVIRSLSLGELEFSDLLSVIWKEIRTSVLCGITLSIACFIKLLIIDCYLLNNPEITFFVAIVVSVAMALTVIVAKVVGCTLPLLAKKIGFDPAVMASPFITTIVDALSLIVYFGIAKAVLF
jgi:magnesium transporter